MSRTRIRSDMKLHARNYASIPVWPDLSLNLVQLGLRKEPMEIKVM